MTRLLFTGQSRAAMSSLTTGRGASCRSATGPIRGGSPTAASNGYEAAMVIDRQKLYHRSRDFFDCGGNAVMKLSREAAIAVCSDVTRRGLLVLGIEGG